MAVKVKRFLFFVVFLIVSVFLILLQSSGLMTLQIGTASAVLILPAVMYGGFYFGCYTGALLGFVSGVLTDVYSAPLCYNTVVLTLLGFACGLITMYLFNRNLAAVCVLSPSVSFLYFFVKWLVIYAFSDPVPGFVLLHYTLPSFIYTAAVGILMFFIINPAFKYFPAEVRK